MILNQVDQHSIDSSSSSSSIIIDTNKKRSFLFSCYGCFRTNKNNEILSKSIRDLKQNEERSFLKRIQCFKAQKRQSLIRKQQQLSTNIHLNNDSPTIDIDEKKSIISLHSLNERCTHNRIHNSHSIPLLNQHETNQNVTPQIEAYSFNDIDIDSSINDDKSQIKYSNRSATPKSILSNNLSLTTTNLSAYSTQSLLRKLLFKTQILDDYYNEKINNRRLSTNSLSPTIKARTGYNRVTDIYNKRSQRKKFRLFYDNISSDSSRFNLYVDEDNILRELIRFNNDIDLILSRLDMDGENLQQQINRNRSLFDENLIQQTIIDRINDSNIELCEQINDKYISEQAAFDDTIIMRTDTNEIPIHLLLSHDIDRLRETALAKLLKMFEGNQSKKIDQTITLTKLNKLPKSTTWKGKHVFGVPLRIYQQTTGHILPIAITHALEYVRIHAGKCEGLFRKPGVKSKIDHLRTQIEMSNDLSSEISTVKIDFDEYQPFVVADVIRQYFRELPECLIPTSITRLLCDLLKSLAVDEQLSAIRYIFLLLPDETREVLEIILRFLLDFSIRSGNSQTTCRNLARIFVPSVFQSYHDIHNTSSKILWWKWKKTKSDVNQQESERLLLEHCLMTMILNIDLLCRVPSALTDELKLPSARKTKRLDELIRSTCNGEFHIKKYISKMSEQFLRRLSNTRFKDVQVNVDDVRLSIDRSSLNESENRLPLWKCSIEIPNTNVKQIYQRIANERHLWDNQLAESRMVEKIDSEKEIVQYVLNFLDLVPVRSFCEFRFMKKISSSSTSDINSILFSTISIDHSQNHFLPGTIGITHDMYYYLTPSTTRPGHTTVVQLACVDYSGRSSRWYENVYGSLLAHKLVSLRDTFSNSKMN